MTATIPNNLSFPFTLEFAPILLVGAAVAYVMVAQILRLGLWAIFLGASLFIAAAWFSCFFSSNLGDLGIITYGLNFDDLTHVAFKVLLPALFIICVMILMKNAPDEKKTASLIMLLISFIGGMVVLTSKNWMVFFVGLQCLSIPIYGLIAFDTSNKFALRASVKYLVISVVAMAFLLFGIVLIYAATGDMDFLRLKGDHHHTINTSTLILFALAMILVGIGFKISLFPFHQWAPDVYEGTSLFATSYLVVIVKAFMVLFLVENLEAIMGDEKDLVTWILTLLAVMSMWIGNGMMLLETRLLRLIGFLSIGHLGFLIIPLIVSGPLGKEAVLIDVTGFGLAILLVLFTLKLMSSKRISFWQIDDLRGVLRRDLWCGVFLLIGFITVIGLPLTAGFIGKYAIVSVGVESELWLLTVSMILSSLLSIFTLAKVLITMGEKVGISSDTERLTNRSRGILLPLAFSLIFFGIFPEPWLKWLRSNLRPVNQDTKGVVHYDSSFLWEKVGMETKKSMPITQNSPALDIGRAK